VIKRARSRLPRLRAAGSIGWLSVKLAAYLAFALSSPEIVVVAYQQF